MRPYDIDNQKYQTKNKYKHENNN